MKRRYFKAGIDNSGYNYFKNTPTIVTIFEVHVGDINFGNGDLDFSIRFNSSQLANDVKRVDWGDGGFERIIDHSTNEITHTYQTPGVYTIKVFPEKGKYVEMCFNNTGDKEKIGEFKKWGNFQLSNGAFYGCGNLKLDNVEGVPRLDNNISSAFRGCGTLFKINNSNEWDFSEVTNISNLFGFCEDLYDLETENWDLGNVSIASETFRDCSSIIELKSGNWGLGNLTDSSYMFSGCHSLTDIDVENWDLTKLNNASGMFNACYSLESIDTSNWVLTNLNDSSNMFYECSVLKELDVGSWNLLRLIDASSMFSLCSSLTDLNGSENWDLSKVEITSSMFEECTALEYIGADNWNFENLEESSFMFSGCVGLKEINTFFWKMPNLKIADSMFAGCINLESLNTTTEPEILWKWELEELEDGSYMFDGCQKLKNIQTSDWNLSKLKNGFRMFRNNYELENIEIDGWNINSLENAREMFLNCYLLNINVEDFDLVNCTDIRSFSRNTQFKSICLKNCQNIELIDSYAFNVDVDNLEKVLLEGIQVDFDVSTFNLATKEDLIDLANGTVYNTISYGGVGTVTNKTVTLPDNNFYTGEKAEIELEFSNKGWTVNWVFNQTERPFIAEIKTTSSFENVNLPLEDFISTIDRIDWGNGIIDTIDVHTYETPGTYIVKVYPQENTFVNFKFNNTGSKDNIYKIIDWGERYAITENAFEGCSNLTLTNTIGEPYLYTLIDFAFSKCDSITTINNINNWDFSSVQSAMGLFTGSENYKQDITNIDTSALENVWGMFYDCGGTESFRIENFSFEFVNLMDDFVNETNVKTLCLKECQNIEYGMDTVFNVKSDDSLEKVFLEGITVGFDISKFKNATEQDLLDLINGGTFNGVTYGGIGIAKDPFQEITLPWNNFTQIEQDNIELAATDKDWTVKWSGLILTDPFVAEFKTISSFENVNLPTIDHSNTIELIDWGDGILDSSNIHIYESPGTYEIKIYPKENNKVNLKFNNGTHKNKIHNVLKWGDYILESDAFYGCTNLKLENVEGVPEIGDDIQRAFRGCTSLINVDASGWDVSGVLLMSGLFNECSSLENVNISGWDISSVTEINAMFNLTNLNSRIENLDLNSCNNVTNFANETRIKTIGFKNCGNLTTLNNNSFNPRPNYLQKIFLENIQIDFDISNFNYATEQDLLDLINGGTFNGVTYGGIGDVSGMTITLPDNNFTDDEKNNIETEASNKGWNIDWFYNDIPRPFIAEFKTTSNNETITIPTLNHNTTVNVIDWGDGVIDSNNNHEYESPGTYEVKIRPKNGQLIRFRFSNSGDKDKIYDVLDWGSLNIASNTFWGCSNLELKNTKGVPIFNSSSMSRAFQGCSSVTNINNSNDWDFSNVTIFTNAFQNMSSMTHIESSDWVLNSATDLSNMFRGCVNLEYIDTENWDVSSVEKFQGTFRDCKKLTYLDVSQWGTSSATTMAHMFNGCEQLGYLELTNWDVSNVTDMQGMFNGCSNFNADVSQWNVSSVKNMNSLFNYCNAFDNGGSGELNWTDPSTGSISVEDIGAIIGTYNDQANTSLWGLGLQCGNVNTVPNRYYNELRFYYLNVCVLIGISVDISLRSNGHENESNMGIHYWEVLAWNFADMNGLNSPTVALPDIPDAYEVEHIFLYKNWNVIYEAL